MLMNMVCVIAQDWPQWRGPNRDDVTTGIKVPDAWPKELTQKWKVTVGRGDASPALVGERLYVFVRDESGEVILCLDAASGKEIWRDKYEAQASNEPMGQHPGPRSSPAVASGKVITYGVRGTLSCLDAATGKMIWRKDDFPGTWPRFFTASSPLIAGTLCIAQLGSEDKGGVMAYELSSGEPKWKWADDGTAYSSPVLMSVEGTQMVVALTSKRIVGIGAADGKLLWESPFAPQGRAYNAATPIVKGSTVIYAGSGRGAKAVNIVKSGDGFSAKELWTNADNAVQFNTPVLKKDQLFGLSQKGELFCLDAQDGKTLWNSPLGGRDFGSIVDAGSVLFALTPQGDLTVFEPSDKELKKLVSYKVSGTATYAHPIVSRNRIFVKDQDSLALWTID
jgi:outer membrane protein assembly factor BamB